MTWGPFAGNCKRTANKVSPRNSGGSRAAVTSKMERFVIIVNGSRAAATSKMERFVIIVNDFQPLTIITMRSILDVAAVLDPSLLEKLS